MIQIRSFEDSDAVAFRLLNEHWIQEHFHLEEQDHLALGNPGKYIIEGGGHILMAVDDDVPIGCCALIAEAPGVFELAKMAVAPAYRGRGIGRQLLAHTIAKAKELGAHTLVLGSNTKLADAIHLYEAFGFRHLLENERAPSPYARANVFMELRL